VESNSDESAAQTGSAIANPQDKQDGSPVITSRFQPSRLLGSVATTVCCPAFTCFVSTSRCLFVSAHWETAVFEMPPTNDLDMRLRLRFGYLFKLKRNRSELLHDMFCAKLDNQGEVSHESLAYCLSSLIAEFKENHVISWVKVA